jgi:hypothetical protein
MSLIPVDATHITTAVVNDATYLRQFLDWANARYSSYNQNLTVGVMNAAGIASGDQTYILAFIADLDRIITLAGGTVPATADIIDYNINALLGLQS